MPIKIDTVSQIPVRKRSRNKLFREDNIINTGNIKFDAHNVMKDSHIDSLHNFVIKVVDKLGPVINKYPKIYRKVMKITEKMLKNQIV